MSNMDKKDLKIDIYIYAQSANRRELTPYFLLCVSKL